jgi:hypothetical protein
MPRTRRPRISSNLQKTSDKVHFPAEGGFGFFPSDLAALDCCPKVDGAVEVDEHHALVFPPQPMARLDVNVKHACSVKSFIGVHDEIPIVSEDYASHLPLGFRELRQRD